MKTDTPDSLFSILSEVENRGGYISRSQVDALKAALCAHVPPLRPEWDGWVRFQSECKVNGVTVPAGTAWGPFEKSRDVALSESGDIAPPSLVIWLQAWWKLPEAERDARLKDYGPDVAHLLRGVADMIEQPFKREKVSSDKQERLWDIAGMLEFQAKQALAAGELNVRIDAMTIVPKIVEVMRAAAGPEVPSARTDIAAICELDGCCAMRATPMPLLKAMMHAVDTLPHGAYIVELTDGTQRSFEHFSELGAWIMERERQHIHSYVRGEVAMKRPRRGALKRTEFGCKNDARCRPCEWPECGCPGQALPQEWVDYLMQRRRLVEDRISTSAPEQSPAVAAPDRQFDIK